MFEYNKNSYFDEIISNLNDFCYLKKHSNNYIKTSFNSNLYFSFYCTLINFNN